MGLVGDVLYGIGSGDLFALDVANDLHSFGRSRPVARMEDVGGPARVSHVTPIDGAVYMNARDGFYGLDQEPTDHYNTCTYRPTVVHFFRPKRTRQGGLSRYRPGLSVV